MESLLNADINVLLPSPSLDHLHAEARAWGTTIDFWKSEALFFRYLLHHHRLPEHEEKRRDQLLQDLNQLCGDALENLKQAVAAHEVFIGGLMQEDDGAGSEKHLTEHRSLFNQVTHFEADFRKLKRAIFDFEKKF